MIIKYGKMCVCLNRCHLKKITTKQKKKTTLSFCIYSFNSLSYVHKI